MKFKVGDKIYWYDRSIGKNNSISSNSGTIYKISSLKFSIRFERYGLLSYGIEEIKFLRLKYIKNENSDILIRGV